MLYVVYVCTYRAAMKMANMDAVFDFMFTGMRDKSGVSCVLFILHYTHVLLDMYVRRQLTSSYSQFPLLDLFGVMYSM